MFAISASRRALASGCRQGGQIELWKLRSQKRWRVIDIDLKPIRVMQYLKKDTCLAVAGGDALSSKIKVWNLQTDTLLKTLQCAEHTVLCMLELPIPDLLVTGGADAKLKTWDIEREQMVQEFSVHQSAVTCLDIDAPGLLLWSASQSEVKVWKISSKISLFAAYEGFRGPIASLLANQKQVIAGGSG